MGSTLADLREDLRNQINVKVPTSNTTPSLELLNFYINKAIRRIVRHDKPREMLLATPIEIDVVTGNNTVDFPTTMVTPNLVYYQRGNETRRLIAKNLKDLIELVNENSYFNTNNKTNFPNYWDLRGSKLIFDRQFDQTATGAIKVFGVQNPTKLTFDTDESPLVEDWDILTVYEAALLFFQRQKDPQMIREFQGFIREERNELRLSMDSNDELIVELDRCVFTGVDVDIRNPNVLFQS